MNQIRTAAKVVSLWMVIGFISGIACAAEGAEGRDLMGLSRDSLPGASSSQTLDELIEQYLNDRGAGTLRSDSGKFYYSAKAPVGLPIGHPQWAKARQIAFEKALLRAKSQFIFDQFGRMIRQTEEELVRDDGDLANVSQDLSGRSRLEALWGKAVALGEAHVDQLLEEAGVDGSHLDVVPPAQRRDLFVNSYISKTLRTAVGDSSGLLPVQSFSGSDASGGYAVGVVMLYSSKLKRFAYGVANGRLPSLSHPEGNPLEVYVDLPESELSNLFGLRVVFSESGSPLLVSYGQWGFSFGGKSQSRLSREYEAAARMADTKATEQIVSFVSAQISMTSESETGEIVENFLIERGSNVTEHDVTRIVDRMSQQISENAEASLAGSRVARTWSYKHPDAGVQIVGSIRVWSYDGAVASEQVQSFQDGRSRTDPAVDSYGASAGAEFFDPEEAF